MLRVCLIGTIVIPSCHFLLPSLFFIDIFTDPDAIWLEKLGFGSYVSQLESKHIYATCVYVIKLAMMIILKIYYFVFTKIIGLFFKSGIYFANWNVDEGGGV